MRRREGVHREPLQRHVACTAQADKMPAREGEGSTFCTAYVAASVFVRDEPTGRASDGQPKVSEQRTSTHTSTTFWIMQHPPRTRETLTASFAVQIHSSANTHPCGRRCRWAGRAGWARVHTILRYTIFERKKIKPSVHIFFQFGERWKHELRPRPELQPYTKIVATRWETNPSTPAAVPVAAAVVARRG